ncbi:hypothetical protein HDG35_007312 [Paraburkholderia sp. JPY681]|nr:hypothetical protein [Paraburkholderia atlantica]
MPDPVAGSSGWQRRRIDSRVYAWLVPFSEAVMVFKSAGTASETGECDNFGGVLHRDVGLPIRL